MEKSGLEPQKAVRCKTLTSLRQLHKGKGIPTDKTSVVSTRRRVPTNWFSGRTLQPSIESIIVNSFVPSDFLVDGQVSGLGTVHHLLTFTFFSTWILPLHVVFQR